MLRFIQNLFGTESRQAKRKSRPKHGQRRVLRMEGLESRNLMAAAVWLDADKVLNIDGTMNSDEIAIVSKDIHLSNGQIKDGIQVTITDKTSEEVILQSTAFASFVDKIVVQCFDGADLVTNSTSKPSTMYGGRGTNELHGGTGNDILYATDSFNGWDGHYVNIPCVLQGGGGDDTLYGSSGWDRLRGGSGNDTLYGGDGEDELDGGTGYGNDSLYGGDGYDHLKGNAGNDVLYGQAGADWLEGGSGDDLVDGGAGDDYCAGNAGTDTVAGGPDTDELWGDEGGDPDTNTIDTFYFDLLDTVDGQWGGLFWGCQETAGKYKGYGKYHA